MLKNIIVYFVIAENYQIFTTQFIYHYIPLSLVFSLNFIFSMFLENYNYLTQFNKIKTIIMYINYRHYQ